MSDVVIPTRFQWRRDTSANWAANNPTPKNGEPCLETDTRNWKIGDGATAYNSLGYVPGPLVDPGADRLLFWDDSAGQYRFLTLGTGLSITDTTIDAAGGGSINHSEQFEVFEDYLTSAGSRWTDENSSGGAHTYLAGEANAPGIIRCSLTTASSSTGRACQKIGTTTPILVGGGEIEIEARVRHNTLPTATDNTLTIIGLSNVINAGTFTDRIYAQFTHNGTSAVWSITDQAAGGAVTGTNSTTGASSGVWQKVKLVVNAGATSVDLVVDGTTVLTRALSGTFGPMTAVRRFSWSAGGLTHTCDYDFINVKQTFTSAR